MHCDVDLVATGRCNLEARRSKQSGAFSYYLAIHGCFSINCPGVDILNIAHDLFAGPSSVTDSSLSELEMNLETDRPVANKS